MKKILVSVFLMLAVLFSAQTSCAEILYFDKGWMNFSAGSYFSNIKDQYGNDFDIDYTGQVNWAGGYFFRDTDSMVNYVDHETLKGSIYFSNIGFSPVSKDIVNPYPKNFDYTYNVSRIYDYYEYWITPEDEDGLPYIGYKGIQIPGFSFIFPMELLIPQELDSNILVLHANPADYVFSFEFEEYKYTMAYEMDPLEGIYADYARNALGLQNNDVVYGWLWGPSSFDITFEGNFTITPISAPTPEPGTIFLMGAGLLGMLGMRRRFKK